MIEALEIKQQVKEALYDFFSENNSYLRGIISDVMEDISLGKAIEEGDIGDYIEEKLIMDLLNKGQWYANPLKKNIL